MLKIDEVVKSLKMPFFYENINPVQENSCFLTTSGLKTNCLSFRRDLRDFFFTDSGQRLNCSLLDGIYWIYWISFKGNNPIFWSYPVNHVNPV